MSTQDLINRARERFVHNESKKYLFEKYKNQLLIAHSEGLWSITPEFLSMLRNSPETIILLDNYNNPIEVNTKELLQQSEEIYNSIMSAWLHEFKNLSNKR